MKIAMVYDFSKKKCGIKMYSDLLLAWLKKFGVNVKVCDLKNEKYRDSIEAAICASSEKLVHTQHEYGLFKGHFGWSHIFYYLTLKLLKKRNITTLHTVLTPVQAIENYVRFALPFSKEKPLEVARGFLVSAISPYIPLLFSDALVVHTIRGYELLPEWARSKTSLIPHFSPIPSSVVIVRAKECAKKPKNIKKINAVTPGFIRPTKRYDWAIHAMVMLKKEGFKYPIEYTIIGTYQNEDGKKWLSYIREFAHEVNKYTQSLGLKVNVIEKHMDKKELIETACNAHVVVLPYSDPTQEASGILHDSLVCGKHIVVPEIGDVKTFKKAFYSFKFERPLETMKEALGRAFSAVISGRICNEWALAYAYYTSIDRIAKKHEEFYSKFLSRKGA